MVKVFQFTGPIIMGVVMAILTASATQAGATAGLKAQPLELSPVGNSKVITLTLPLTQTGTPTPTIAPGQSRAQAETGTPEPLWADANDDGRLNIQDLVYVSGYFGSSDPRVDLNSDGTVNVLDIALIANLIDQSQPVEDNVTGQPLTGVPPVEDYGDDEENVALPSPDQADEPEPEVMDDLDFLTFFSDNFSDPNPTDPEATDTPPLTESEPSPEPTIDPSTGSISPEARLIIFGDPFALSLNEDSETEMDYDAFDTIHTEAMQHAAGQDEAAHGSEITVQAMAHNGDAPQKNDDVENGLAESALSFSPESATPFTPKQPLVPLLATATSSSPLPPARANITCDTQATPKQSVDICTLVSIGVWYGACSSSADMNADGLVDRLDLEQGAAQYHTSFMARLGMR